MGGHAEMWYTGMQRCMLLLWAMLGTHMQLGGRLRPLLPAGAPPPGAGAPVKESPLLQEMTAGELHQNLGCLAGFECLYTLLQLCCLTLCNFLAIPTCCNNARLFPCDKPRAERYPQHHVSYISL